MPVHKYNLRGSAKVGWFYKFDLPASTRKNRTIIRGWGFETKKAAEDAERKRYDDELQKIELAKAGPGVSAAPPKTLGMLLEEFMRQHAVENLAPTTILSYQEKAAYLD